MMKIRLSLYFVLVLSLVIAFANTGWTCTTFVLQTGDRQVFGRNFDWHLDDALVVVNKRGCSKKSFPIPGEKGVTAAWTATYGSITFNQYGREMPMGGINEAGLVVETMTLRETRYPEPDDRPYLGDASLWRQYLLDTCSTVAQVIAGNKNIRISNKGSGPGTHILVLDRSGDCAAIEFIDGRMEVHSGKEMAVKVLTNDTYAKSLQCLRNNQPPILNTWKSINRFITAAKRNQNCQAKTTDELVTFAFGTLEAVSSRRTQWRIIYDNIDMRVYFRTKKNNKKRYFDVTAFDFSPKTPVRILDLNADLSGDVTNQFTDYTYSANRDLIGRTYSKTDFLSRIPDKILDAIARFPEKCECH